MRNKSKLLQLEANHHGMKTGQGRKKKRHAYDSVRKRSGRSYSQASALNRLEQLERGKKKKKKKSKTTGVVRATVFNQEDEYIDRIGNAFQLTHRRTSLDEDIASPFESETPYQFASFESPYDSFHASTKQPVFEAPRLIKRSEPHIINPQEPEQREIRAIRRGRTSENASSLLNEESPPGHSQIKQDATSILDGDIEEELSSLLFEQGMQDLANGKNTFSPALNVNGGSDYTSPPTRPPQPHAIFDRIGQSLQHATTFDIGDINLESSFDLFDKVIEHDEGVAHSKSSNKSLTPELDEMDIIEDFALMQSVRQDAESDLDEYVVIEPENANDPPGEEEKQPAKPEKSSEVIVSDDESTLEPARDTSENHTISEYTPPEHSPNLEQHKPAFEGGLS